MITWTRWQHRIHSAEFIYSYHIRIIINNSSYSGTIRSMSSRSNCIIQCKKLPNLAIESSDTIRGIILNIREKMEMLFKVYRQWFLYLMSPIDRMVQSNAIISDHWRVDPMASSMASRCELITQIPVYCLRGRGRGGFRPGEDQNQVFCSF